MKTSSRILVVAALMLAAGGVLVLKQVFQPAAPAVAAHASKLPRLLDLGAGNCMPCKAMAPILEALQKECTGRLEVAFLDVWQNPAAARQYGVDIIPVQIFFSADGRELFRHTGFFSREDILGKWRELGVNLGPAP